MSNYYSGEGDDGYTRLLGSSEVPKYDLRPQAYGALDEASAALGLARSLAQSKKTKEVIVEVQRDLYRMMAEIAALPEDAKRLEPFREDRLRWLETEVDEFGDQLEMPAGFILPGDSQSGAALDLARTIVRRAERLVARLMHEGKLTNNVILSYTNRLSSLCFVLALREYKKSGVEHPTPARKDRR